MAKAGRVVALALASALVASVGVGAGYTAQQGYHAATRDPTVRVDTNMAVGTGVYIGHHVVITAAHMVDGADGHVPDGSSITVTVDHAGAPGETVHATLVWYDKAYDIAALQIDTVPADLGTATLDADPAAIGQKIEIVGTPLGQSFIHTWGRVAGIARDESGPPLDGWKLVQPVDIAFTNGNSGGPVYAEGTDTVVGIVVGEQLNVQHDTVMPGTVQFAVPSTAVLKLIAQHAHDASPMPLPTTVADGQ